MRQFYDIGQHEPARLRQEHRNCRVAKLIQVGFASSLVACSGLMVPNEAPTVEGTVVSWATIPTPPDVTPGGGIRILTADESCNDVTVWIKFVPREFVKRSPDGSLKSAVFNDLRLGQAVRAWTIEPVMGCPWSGTGRFVEIEP